MKQAYIFIGRSGCGKGTQANLLIEQLTKQGRDIFSLETGNKFREFIKEETYSSKLAKGIIERGELQPEFLAISMWTFSMIKTVKGNEDFVLDGTPRKMAEAKTLDSAMRFYGFVKPIVIFINVSREWSEEKLLARGRGDDEVEKIKRRMDWFDTDVIPVLDFYKNHSGYDFLEINGDQTREEVHQEIMNNLSQKSKVKSL